MTKKDDGPRWGYRKGADGKLESKIFEGELPKGWVDTPAKVKLD